MIHDVLVRSIVTALFVFSAAECIYAVATGGRTPTNLVSQALHFVMAVAMAVMAWPGGAALPTTGPMLFFLAATAWFVVVTLARPGHRGVNAYHAFMMLAMAWMYAVMGGSLLPVPAEGASGTGGGHGHHASAGHPTHLASDPPLVTGLNWLCTVGFVVAAICWLGYLLRLRRRTPPTIATPPWFGVIAQAMMAAGMAIMFGVML